VKHTGQTAELSRKPDAEAGLTNPDCTGTVGRDFVLCGEEGYYCSDRCWTIGRLRAARAQVAEYERQLGVYLSRGSDRSRLPDQTDRSVAIHLAYIEAHLASFSRGGTCRAAACFCGWRGAQRGTLELAVDDALEHERDGRLPMKT
jgi:hypothetical protein